MVRHHRGGDSLIRPAAGPYRYRLGDDFFVAPIYRDGRDHSVQLPEGRWRLLAADARVLEGPRTVAQVFALEDYPVYVRDGAIVPMHVSRAYSGFGDAAASNHLTWAIWPLGSNSFLAQLPDRSGVASARVMASAADIEIALAGVPQPHIPPVHLPEGLFCYSGEPPGTLKLRRCVAGLPARLDTAGGWHLKGRPLATRPQRR